ncbi:MAG: acetate--CoA ligase family protein [Desulfobacterales bacterium]|nr:MAG: acetate--CoA ligase family protein [Desulfobacterales bacterium]
MSLKPIDTARDVLQNALARRQTALSEYQSKMLLRAYGVPVTKEALAHSIDEALSLAETIGYPVALKACAPELMHKTESGLIELNIQGSAALQTAYQRLTDAAAFQLEGLLVQEMIRGPRELVLGLSRDLQFGPCVMLGLGGILTEVIDDVVFRVAPLDFIEAREMTLELRSKAILERFRGQAAADRDAICRSLVALGRIGLENEAIAEIDINPMIISPQGQVVVVDALIVLAKRQDLTAERRGVTSPI